MPAAPARAPAPSHLPRRGTIRSARILLPDGARTTLHVALHDLARVEVRVAVVRARPLVAFCARRGVADALVGGFFTRPDGMPLGEVRTRGVLRRHVPFTAPYGDVRACVSVRGGVVRIAGRAELDREPAGDLLQAGPLLVREGRATYVRAEDPEGFSAGAAQFDSDITLGRHPRAAIGLIDGPRPRILAVAIDGRSRHDAGVTLEELAEIMAALGAETAMNLDGGGSTTLVAGGRLRNRPRGSYERPEPGGRAVSTALLFVPRR
jgi:hypothetical protein